MQADGRRATAQSGEPEKEQPDEDDEDPYGGVGVQHTVKTEESKNAQSKKIPEESKEVLKQGQTSVESGQKEAPGDKK